MNSYSVWLRTRRPRLTAYNCASLQASAQALSSAIAAGRCYASPNGALRLLQDAAARPCTYREQRHPATTAHVRMACREWPRGAHAAPPPAAAPGAERAAAAATAVLAEVPRRRVDRVHDRHAHLGVCRGEPHALVSPSGSGARGRHENRGRQSRYPARRRAGPSAPSIRARLRGSCGE